MQLRKLFKKIVIEKSIIVNGKKIDPESEQGKKVESEMDKMVSDMKKDIDKMFAAAQ